MPFKQVGKMRALALMVFVSGIAPLHRLTGYMTRCVLSHSVQCVLMFGIPQIKDSARTLHTRRRRSVRGRLLNLADRSIGWIIVTIVGFLTAVIAFLIIRAEQWLFDIKEGYCSEAWWRAMRFCCPMSVDNQSLRIASIPAETEACEAWTTWAEAFGPGGKHDSWYGFESWMIEYVSYMAIAVSKRWPESSYELNCPILARLGSHIVIPHHQANSLHLVLVV